MINFLIKSYKNLNSFNRFSFWLCLGFAICMTIFLLLICKGWPIPTDDEIHYTKGKMFVVTEHFQTQRGRSSVRHIQMHTDDGQTMYFKCGYSAYDYIEYSGCWADPDLIKSAYGSIGHNDSARNNIRLVHGKYGEIGWYTQKPLLWLNNPYPQLISLTIWQDGKLIPIRNKEVTIQSMQSHPSEVSFFILGVWVIFSLMFLFGYKYIGSQPHFNEE